MTSQPSTSTRLKNLAKRIPDERLIHGMLRVLAGRHVSADYPIAIAGAAVIERALEAAILSRCIPLDEEERKLLFNFEQGGPLADFGTRIRFAHALGLFGPKTHQDLKHINVIRNLFAHSTSLLGFSEDEIKDACAGFNMKDPLPSGLKPEGLAGPQGQYITACLQIAARLKLRLEEEAQNALSAASKLINFPSADGRLP
jgi:hypothetical protein